MSAPKIALVDNHQAIIRGLVGPLQQEWPDAYFMTAEHVADILESGDMFDVVVLDVMLNDGTDPVDNVAAVVARGWPVLLYTQDTRAAVIAHCFHAGASGIVSKDQDQELVHAARTVLGGGPYLSSDWAHVLATQSIPDLPPREREALQLFGTGLPVKSVARRMGISQETVNGYLVNVRNRYSQVGRPAPSRVDLYIRAVEDGILPSPVA